jgi:hypothetical protein
VTWNFDYTKSDFNFLIFYLFPWCDWKYAYSEWRYWIHLNGC